MARKSKADGRGGIQVLRIKTHPWLGGGLLEHDSGRVRPDNVREVPEGEATVVPHTTLVNEVRAKFALQAVLERRLEDARRAGRRAGRMPHHAVEFVFQGAGRYGTGYEWSREREAAFERACRAWVEKILGPGSTIAVVCAHRDELTHHVHVVAIPVHEGRLGWCAVRDAALARIEKQAAREAGERGEEPPKRRKGTRRYALLQDDFHERVGRHFGLERGERASGRRHQEIDRGVAIEVRAEQAEERERVANEGAEAAEKRKKDTNLSFSDLCTTVAELKPKVVDLRRAREEEEALKPKVVALRREREAEEELKPQTVDLRRAREAEDALKPQTDRLRREREAEEALTARWAVGKKAALAAEIRDGYETRIQAAQDETLEEVKLRGLAEEQIRTVQRKAREEAKTAKATIEAEKSARQTAETAAAADKLTLTTTTGELDVAKAEIERLSVLLTSAWDRANVLATHVEHQIQQLVEKVAGKAAAVAEAWQAGYAAAVLGSGRAVGSALDGIGMSPSSPVLKLIQTTIEGVGSSSGPSPAQDRDGPGRGSDRDR